MEVRADKAFCSSADSTSGNELGWEDGVPWCALSGGPERSPWVPVPAPLLAAGGLSSSFSWPPSHLP